MTVQPSSAKYDDFPTPITLGLEITGVVHKIGAVLPKVARLQKGDHIAVAPGWGAGVWRHCPVGNTTITSLSDQVRSKSI